MNPLLERREHFAVMAMVGLLAGTHLRTRCHPSGNPTLPRVWRSEDLAEDAVACADALCARLDDDPPPQKLFDLVRELAAIPFGQQLDQTELGTLATLIAEAGVLVEEKAPHPDLVAAAEKFLGIDFTPDDDDPVADAYEQARANLQDAIAAAKGGAQ